MNTAEIITKVTMTLLSTRIQLFQLRLSDKSFKLEDKTER